MLCQNALAVWIDFAKSDCFHSRALKAKAKAANAAEEIQNLHSPTYTLMQLHVNKCIDTINKFIYVSMPWTWPVRNKWSL